MAKLIKRWHDLLYLKENRYKKIKENQAKIISIIDIYVRKKKQNGLKICDIGCADGALIYFVKKKYPKNYYYGLDVHKQLIDRAKKHLNDKKINLSVGSVLEKQNFKSSSFDIVSMMGVLSIFDDHKKVLDNLIHWTKKGGKIIILSIFNPYPYDVKVKYQHSKDIKNKTLQSGWNMYSVQTISKYLKQNKKVKKFKFSNFQLKCNVKFNTKDPLRMWTFFDLKKNKISRNGLNLILNEKFIEIDLV
jgi:ubiquinone/menaquinone biosynthesis C-methylase UbiE